MKNNIKAKNPDKLDKTYFCFALVDTPKNTMLLAGVTYNLDLTAKRYKYWFHDHLKGTRVRPRFELIKNYLQKNNRTLGDLEIIPVSVSNNRKAMFERARSWNQWVKEGRGG